MNRRSFITALAGMPIVGFGARLFGQLKPTAKSGITVHGPELIVINKYPAVGPGDVVSLRFENIPLRGNDPRELVKRLTPAFGIVNRSDWQCYWGTERAGSLMFTDWGESSRENGLCSIVCGFTATTDRPPWPGSHRPVDFETEILKALRGGSNEAWG